MNTINCRNHSTKDRQTDSRRKMSLSVLLVDTCIQYYNQVDKNIPYFEVINISWTKWWSYEKLKEDIQYTHITENISHDLITRLAIYMRESCEYFTTLLLYPTCNPTEKIHSGPIFFCLILLWGTRPSANRRGPIYDHRRYAKTSVSETADNYHQRANILLFPNTTKITTTRRGNDHRETPKSFLSRHQNIHLLWEAMTNNTQHTFRIH